MKRKWLAIGIILLFVGVTIAPAIAQNTEKSQSKSRGDWLYVGGSGPGNYTRIQDAIDNASDGDTVFIYDESSPYKQNFSIDKSLLVRGENKTTTIIRGFNSIRSGYVVVSDLMFWSWGPALTIDGFSNNIIENCVFNQSISGIYLHKSDNTTIRNCSFRDCGPHIILIRISSSDNIEISYCDFFENHGDYPAINVAYSYGIEIHHCTITHSFGGGVLIQVSRGIMIHHCNITHNYGYGAGVTIGASVVHLRSNNFINNKGSGVEFAYLATCDLRDNWWGSPRGPSINFTTYLSLIILDGPFRIRDIENGDTVHFLGFTHIGRFFLLFGLLPWLSEPVADAGSNR